MIKKVQNKQSVKSILANFKKNLFGIDYYFDKFGNLALRADTDEVKKSIEFLKSCLKDVGHNPKNSKSKRGKLQISEDKLTEFIRKLKNQTKISTKNYEILSRSSFLMLNNYFEYLLSDLLSYHYNKFQKSLFEKKFNFTLKEINEYKSIEEVTNAFIIKEVESMMFEKTFDELLDHFQTKLEIDNEKEIINWDLIKECRERRHLIVHNSSKVNKKYISRTNNPFKYNIGDTVHVNTEYFLKSSKEFYLAGLLISYNCWGKWDKDNTDNAINEILIESFELLKQKEFVLVSLITNFAQKIEARYEEQEDILLRIKINRLISLKKLENKENFMKELKKVKTGTASPIFKLAIAILSDNHKNIIDLIKQAKSIGAIDIYKYKEWPIYSFLRDINEINLEIENELKILHTKKTKPKIRRKYPKK
jgi:hypothetical protein